jgi:hypothetical protein
MAMRATAGTSPNKILRTTETSKEKKRKEKTAKKILGKKATQLQAIC